MRCAPGAARAGIDRFALILSMRGARGSENILARAGAGVNQPGRAKLIQGGDINLPSLALRVGPKGPPAIRPFLPVESEPPEVLHHGIHELHAVARGIQILVPQDQDAASRARPLLRDPERPRVAKMQEARGRRREPPAVRLV